MTRETQLEKIRNHGDSQYDIIVIGGGATGLGIALDAATRGYKSILLEKNDFADATSSRSTKLVHGGVRYLAQGDIMLVVEALRERSIILRNAPHVTFKQEFVIPVYSIWDAFLYTAGLKFYDLLSASLSLGKSYFISKEKTVARLPLIRKERLIGGVVYHDGQFDDSRMAMSIVREYNKQGGTAINYFEVDAFVKSPHGSISGVMATDRVSGKKFELKSTLVINATGVFANELIKIDDPSANPILRPSQGVHLVLDKSFLQSDTAIMIPKTDDGRVLFAIPWYDKVVVGTTDTPVNEVTHEPRVIDLEVSFILRNFEKYSTKKINREDILSMFAGLRPLAHNPNKPKSTKEISRRHKILFSESGLLTIIGGKWTTYRLMAEDVIDTAIKAGELTARKCITRELKLNIKPGNLSHQHLSVYGLQAYEIEKLIIDDPGMGERLSPDLPYIKAEIVWICRNEVPVNVDDILIRRTRSAILNAHASSKIAPVVAAIMAKELGHDEDWVNEQIELYNKLIINYVESV